MEKEKESRKKQRTWKIFKSTCLGSDQVQMEKKIAASAHYNKGQLASYMRALFPGTLFLLSPFSLLLSSFCPPSIPPSSLCFSFHLFCMQLPCCHKGETVRQRSEARPSSVCSPLLRGSSLFSRISLASVPSSIRSNLVITPMVLKPTSTNTHRSN